MIDYTRSNYNEALLKTRLKNPYLPILPMWNAGLCMSVVNTLPAYDFVVPDSAREIMLWTDGGGSFYAGKDCITVNPSLGNNQSGSFIGLHHVGPNNPQLPGMMQGASIMGPIEWLHGRSVRIHTTAGSVRRVGMITWS